VALKLIEENDIIAVESMNKAQALILFERKIKTRDKNRDFAELAAIFEFMPLTIV
jgi:hypothetical protein